jgi:nucleotide-binding universal stress UspA family protein
MADAIANVADRPAQTSLGTAVASIMVYVDFDPGSDDRIKIAADWAAKFGAVLIGVAGWLPGREVGGWFAAEVERPEDRDRILAKLDKLAERFRNMAGRAARTVEWRGSVHFPREVIPREARAADLVVISSRPVAEDVYHAFDPGTVLLSRQTGSRRSGRDNCQSRPTRCRCLEGYTRSASRFARCRT